MLQRKISERLDQWKAEGATKAICIIGARQIGKSTIAREFGKKNYQRVIEINFIREPSLKAAFTSPTPSDIYDSLTLLTGTSILPGQTLLILDEIQECPEARTSIKFLMEDHRVDIIETGSLLGVNMQAVKSYPVGFETLLFMYPLTFEEFLWALNVPAESLKTLHRYYENRMPVPQAIHDQMLSLFRLYMVVGGMPDAVQSYVDHQDLAKVKMIHQSILDLYRQDIQKYADRKDRLKIADVFDSIPAQLSSKNKRFKVGKIDKKNRLYQFEDSFLWLEAAGIALPCYNVSSPLYPLLLNEQRNLFKLYLCDTGLLCTALGDQTSFEILKGDIQINLGGVLENMFAQCLKSRNCSLFYFDSKKNYELDFLVQKNNHIEVLEIKSGKYYRSHASLDKALANMEWDLQEAFVFCPGNIEQQGKITYLPFYMVLFYQQEEIEELIWKPDFSALLNFN